MKVLITGARGQVGLALARQAPSGVDLVMLSHEALDISQTDQVARIIAGAAPDVIVNAAAYTDVDRAEREPGLARLANEIGPLNLARAALDAGARLIHISTDFVFDGAASAPYRPQDQPNPLSVYGRTKLGGEATVRSTLPDNSVVLRTSWVYSASGRNFLCTMLRLMRDRGVVRVVADQIGAPTGSDSVARAVWSIVAAPGLAGIYHWADAGIASRYEFAAAISEEAAQLGLLTAPVSIAPIATAEYPARARRPRFSVLDTRATAAAISMTPHHWRVNLRQVLSEISVA